MRTRTSYAVLALLALAGCVRADPVAPDMWCQAPHTVTAGQPWHGTVTACIVPPAIITEIRR